MVVFWILGDCIWGIVSGVVYLNLISEFELTISVNGYGFVYIVNVVQLYFFHCGRPMYEEFSGSKCKLFSDVGRYTIYV